MITGSPAVTPADSDDEDNKSLTERKSEEESDSTSTSDDNLDAELQNKMAKASIRDSLNSVSKKSQLQTDAELTKLQADKAWPVIQTAKKEASSGRITQWKQLDLPPTIMSKLKEAYKLGV